MKVYKIRDKTTGEFISPNNRAKRLWSELRFVKTAINYKQGRYPYKELDTANLEIVEFDCVECGTYEVS